MARSVNFKFEGGSAASKRIRRAVEAVQTQLVNELYSATYSALYTAVYYTPKYSGDTSEDWKVVMDGRRVPQLRGAVDPNLTKAEEIAAPLFVGGITDPENAGFSLSVVDDVMRGFKAEAMARIASDRTINIYIYNSAQIRSIWSDGDIFDWLRKENSTFKTDYELQVSMMSEFQHIARKLS